MISWRPFVASIAVITACAAAYRDPILITVALAYSFVVLLPGLVWVLPLRQSFVSTFLLANIVGFAAGSIYVIIDVVFKIPLTILTFVIVPIIVIAAGIRYWRSFYLIRHERHHEQDSKSVSDEKNV